MVGETLGVDLDLRRAIRIAEPLAGERDGARAIEDRLPADVHEVGGQADFRTTFSETAFELLLSMSRARLEIS